MNWKDAPHLFANGKFKAMLEWGDFAPRDIRGYSNGIKGFLMYGDGGRFYRSIDVCTLIARPISDMADEELYQVWGNERQTAYEIRKTLIYQAEAWTLKATSLLGMIGMGVYPFDQSHFDDGTVIDATKLETE